MDFQVKTTAKVKVIRFAFTIPLINQTHRFSYQVYRSPDTWATGISNRCMDSRYIVFLDFDNLSLDQVKDEVAYLQKLFRSSHYFIFELDRDKSYHAICLDKHSFKKVYKIMGESSIEWSYLHSARMCRGREWVLRISGKGDRGKPKFVCVMHSPYDEKEISTAHKKFLEYRYPELPKLNYKYEDNITELPIIDYSTGNRVQKNDENNH